MKTEKKTFDIQTNPMTVGDLMCLFQGMLNRGSITKFTKISLAVDEEGNAYAPLTLQGITIEEDKRGNNVISIYPIDPKQE